MWRHGEGGGGGQGACPRSSRKELTYIPGVLMASLFLHVCTFALLPVIRGTWGALSHLAESHVPDLQGDRAVGRQDAMYAKCLLHLPWHVVDARARLVILETDASKKRGTALLKRPTACQPRDCRPREEDTGAHSLNRGWLTAPKFLHLADR